MPTELTQVHEYLLIRAPDGAFVYSLYDTTLHPDLRSAHGWINRRLRAEGTGAGVRRGDDELPGKAFTTSTVEAAEWTVEVGQDMQQADILMPFEEGLPEGGTPLPEDDAPLPPDEDLD